MKQTHQITSKPALPFTKITGCRLTSQITILRSNIIKSEILFVKLQKIFQDILRRLTPSFSFDETTVTKWFKDLIMELIGPEM